MGDVTIALRLITILGGPAVRVVLVAECCASLLLWGRWRPALFLAGTVAGTGAANTAVKKVVDRRRPQPLISLERDGESFPSGHASGTIALMGGGTYVVWDLTRRTVPTVTAALIGAALSALVGYSRIRLSRHHVSDVIAGYVLGVACLAAAVAVERRIMPTGGRQVDG